jgi:hypothetical protein
MNPPAPQDRCGDKLVTIHGAARRVNPERHWCNAGSGRTPRERSGAGPVLRPRASCSRAQHHGCASQHAPGLWVTTLDQARHQRRTSDGAPLPPGGVSMIDSNRVNTQTRRWRRSSRRLQSTAVCVVCQRVRRASRRSARLPASHPPPRSYEGAMEEAERAAAGKLLQPCFSQNEEERSRR